MCTHSRALVHRPLCTAHCTPASLSHHDPCSPASGWDERSQCSWEDTAPHQRRSSTSWDTRVSTLPNTPFLLPEAPSQPKAVRSLFSKPPASVLSQVPLTLPPAPACHLWIPGWGGGCGETQRSTGTLFSQRKKHAHPLARHFCPIVVNDALTCTLFIPLFSRGVLSSWTFFTPTSAPRASRFCAHPQSLHPHSCGMAPQSHPLCLHAPPLSLSFCIYTRAHMCTLMSPLTRAAWAGLGLTRSAEAVEDGDGHASPAGHGGASSASGKGRSLQQPLLPVVGVMLCPSP